MQQKINKPLTEEGHKYLIKEYEQLLNIDRPRVVEGVANAAAEGDRSENAEYIYGKKRLREIDKRIRYLDFLLKDAQVFAIDNVNTNFVCFGSRVSVIIDDEKSKEWTIVGVGETDLSPERISWKAPVAKALLGKKRGDHVTVNLPNNNEIELKITDIKKRQEINP